jgi:hypothetical protein
MEHSESIANLAAALSSFQASVPSVPFDGTNAFLKNRYATLKAMIETARPVLAENGLSVSQIVVSYDGQIGVETVLMHSSGEWISNTAILPPGEEKGKSGAQVAGSTITYLRRYSYAAILGLYADEDTDGNAPQQNAKQAPQKTPQAQPTSNQPAQHWIKDAKSRAAFWRWTHDDMQLTNDEVHATLGVEKVEQYTGTKEQAMAAIKEYAAKKADAMQEVVEQTTLDEHFGPREQRSEAYRQQVGI